MVKTGLITHESMLIIISATKTAYTHFTAVLKCHRKPQCVHLVTRGCGFYHRLKRQKIISSDICFNFSGFAQNRPSNAVTHPV
jgi:hypothetical protein